ncbi:MAG: hypothetical protein M5U15_12755 [Kiritimatiellae bacterium]|nr:hypothetical protein [Kiritimatiellia bacterium]
MSAEAAAEKNKLESRFAELASQFQALQKERDTQSEALGLLRQELASAQRAGERAGQLDQVLTDYKAREEQLARQAAELDALRRELMTVRESARRVEQIEPLLKEKEAAEQARDALEAKIAGLNSELEEARRNPPPASDSGADPSLSALQEELSVARKDLAVLRTEKAQALAVAEVAREGLRKSQQAEAALTVALKQAEETRDRALQSVQEGTDQLTRAANSREVALQDELAQSRAHRRGWQRIRRNSCRRLQRR